MAQNDIETVVIDNGSLLCKVGMGGSNAPSSIFPMTLGQPKIKGQGLKDFYIGNEAEAMGQALRVYHPVSHGDIVDWTRIDSIWGHCFHNILKKDPSETRLIMAESPMTSMANREKAAQLWFENFNIPYLCLANTAFLSLAAAGKTTGIVADCGSRTTVVPVIDGHKDNPGIQSSQVGGEVLTKYLGSLLEKASKNPIPLRALSEIKAKYCYVSGDYTHESQCTRQGDSANSNKDHFTLPDGSVVELGNQRFTCPETLFKPNLVGLETMPLHQSIYFTIKKSDPNLHNTMFQNIVLSGGSSMFNGLSERLRMELINLGSNPEITARPDRMHLGWTGGSILSTLSSIDEKCISKSDYEESGPSILHNMAI